ncbi:hypothetical protein DV735_g5026, partial [Chaetothyriales sp. CBS 134920]
MDSRASRIPRQRPGRRALSTIQLREWTPRFGLQPSGIYKTEEEQALLKYFLQAGAPALARSNISVAFWQEKFPRIAYQNEGVKAALMLCALNLRSGYNHIRLQIPVTGLNPQAVAYENQVIKGLVQATPSIESILIASCALWMASLTVGEWAKALQHCFHALRIIEGLQDRSKCDPLVLRFTETLSRSALGYFRLTRGPCQPTSVELRLADTLYHLSKALASLDHFQRRLESRRQQHKDHDSLLELVHRQQREIRYLSRRWSDISHTGVDPELFKASAGAVPITLSPFTQVYTMMADLIEHDEQSRFTYKEVELHMRMMLTNFMAASCQNHPVLLADMYLSMAWRRNFSSNAAQRSNSPRVLVNDMANQELIIETAPGQALDTFALDPAVKAVDMAASDSGVKITWSGPTSHESYFDWTWLQQHTPFPTPKTTPTARHQRTRGWKHWAPSSSFPTTEFDSIISSSPDKSTPGLKQVLSHLQTYGFSFITSAPATPEATETLLNAIGPIRHTHYGGFWDFTSVVNPIDTAYTNDYLPAHTDNTYFTDPAGLQMFHLLSHMPATTADPQLGEYVDGLGGESIFVDGFAAASHLYNIDRKAYHYLSTIPIVSHASGSSAGSFINASLHSAGDPVFTHHLSNSSSAAQLTPENLTCIRWNNLDRSPLTQFPSHQALLQWYKAASLWAQILESKEFEITVPLRPGGPVVFDNWRVLHGRRGFEGKRRVCGGYIGVDDWKARGRALGLDI